MKGFGRKQWMLLAAGCGLLLGYSRLSESRKMFIRNLVAQARYLPGRYFV